MNCKPSVVFLKKSFRLWRATVLLWDFISNSFTLCWRETTSSFSSFLWFFNFETSWVRSSISFDCSLFLRVNSLIWISYSDYSSSYLSLTCLRSYSFYLINSSFFVFIFFSILSISLKIAKSFIFVTNFYSPCLTFSDKNSFMFVSISIFASLFSS